MPIYPPGPPAPPVLPCLLRRGSCRCFPPLTTSTLGDQTRARTVAARSRPGSCCTRPLTPKP
eukprot:1509623-Prymnesium_polylepis.1